MSDSSKPSCPICHSVCKRNQLGDKHEIECPLCGKYEINGTLSTVLKNNPNEDYTKLSAAVRQENLYESNLFLTTYNYEEILKRKEFSVLEKQKRLLIAFEKKSNYPGHEVQLRYDNDYVLAWASNSDEFHYHLESLKDRNLINNSDSSKDSYNAYITTQGWQYLESLIRGSAENTQVFVAMSFEEEYEEVYKQAIKPALETLNYNPYRVDKDPHIEMIDSKIIAEIKHSTFVIADVTGQKAGVYYEAGYGMGLGLPVIWAVNEKELENVHFDTRQFNHIVWQDNEYDSFKNDLTNTIKANIKSMRSIGS